MFACAGLPVLRHLQGCRMTDFRLGHQLMLCLPLRVLERLDVAPLRFTVGSFLVAFTPCETKGSSDVGSAVSPSSGLTVSGRECG